MEGLLEFAKGPLFRFTFGIMTLGLLRIFFLQVYNGIEAKGKAKEKKLPMKYIRKHTFGNLFLYRSIRTRPAYSIFSIIFHVGLLLTPLFLFDHLLLFDNSIGLAWLGLALPKGIADFLTIVTIVSALILIMFRISGATSRSLSRKQDYLWPLILIVPFISGFVCANAAVTPGAYNSFILVHILSAEIIFLLLPFTKIAHCILMPISQWVTARAWKFPPQAGEDILITLGKEGEKI